MRASRKNFWIFGGVGGVRDSVGLGRNCAFGDKIKDVALGSQIRATAFFDDWFL